MEVQRTAQRSVSIGFYMKINEAKTLQILYKYNVVLGGLFPKANKQYTRFYNQEYPKKGTF